MFALARRVGDLRSQTVWALREGGWLGDRPGVVQAMLTDGSALVRVTAALALGRVDVSDATQEVPWSHRTVLLDRAAEISDEALAAVIAGLRPPEFVKDVWHHAMELAKDRPHEAVRRAVVASTLALLDEDRVFVAERAAVALTPHADPSLEPVMLVLLEHGRPWSVMEWLGHHGSAVAVAPDSRPASNGRSCPNRWPTGRTTSSSTLTNPSRAHSKTG